MHACKRSRICGVMHDAHRGLHMNWCHSNTVYSLSAVDTYYPCDVIYTSHSLHKTGIN